MAKSTVIAAQTKAEDGRFARENGLVVPQIYDTFLEMKGAVINEGTKVIARSEHPSELEGLSGLNYSPIIDPASMEDRHPHFEDEYYSERIFNTFARQFYHKRFQFTKLYCEQNNIDFTEYLSKLEHSYWEYIKGYNIYIFADPVVSGRYRIFVKWSDWSQGEAPHAYGVIDNGRVVFAQNLPEFVVNKVPEVIALYRRSQVLFGIGICWTVEMQLSDSGELFFLQRSIGKEFSGIDWSLSSSEEVDFTVSLESGYGEVCGKTTKDGVTVELMLSPSKRYNWLDSRKPTAVLSAHINQNSVEQKVIQTTPVFIECSRQEHGDCISDPHSAIIPMTRSSLYLFIPNFIEDFSKKFHEKIDKVQKRKDIENEGSEYGHITDIDRITCAKLHIVSDGSNASIKVLDIY